MIRTAAIAALAALPAAALAESRELGAHEHGHGALNIAFEGGVVAMELEVPGADIVGFEHPAENAEDRAAIDGAIAALAKPLDLFLIPAEAGCAVTAAEVALVTEGEDDHDEHHDEKHDDHAHDEDHADEHGDEHAHDEDHAEEAKHDDDHAHDHDEEAGHTEFHAEYALACADPGAIGEIGFAYFERFPNAEELEVQLISDKGSKGFEVERDDPRLDLSGAI